MTNDELEAVRARADEYVEADQEWLAIRSQRTCPLSRHDRERLHDVAARIAALHARANRAEAHAERLAGALPDPHKLETLAMWFDRTDASRGHTGTGVQDDLRAWAVAARQALSAYKEDKT